MSDDATPAKVRLTDGLGPRCDTCAHSHKKDDTHPCRGCDAGSAWVLADKPPRPYSLAAVLAWCDAARYSMADLRQQLADEKRQHDITRGDLARTRLACDELLAADDGRNVVIGGRPAPVAICTRMDLTDAQREQLRTTMVVTKA